MEGVGGLSGWRWIFILEGIATVILSIVSAVFLPANLESAKFLTEEERTFASKWAASLTSAKAPNINSKLTLDLARRFRMDESMISADAIPVERNTHEKENTIQTLESSPKEVFNAHQAEEFEWREVMRGISHSLAWYFVTTIDINFPRSNRYSDMVHRAGVLRTHC